jgi:hypothetical protein
MDRIERIFFITATTGFIVLMGALTGLCSFPLTSNTPSAPPITGASNDQLAPPVQANDQP